MGPPSVVAFLADGTYIDVDPLQGTGVGVWRATDPRSGEVLVEWPNRTESGRHRDSPLPDGYFAGWNTLQSSFTLTDDEMTYAGAYRMQRYYPNGVSYGGEQRSDIAGTRIVAESSGAATGDLASHPILGAWAPDTDPPGQGPRAREIFHPDGTFLLVTSCCGAGVGVWQPTDERAGELIVQFPNRNPPTGEYAEGTTVIRKVFTVADGDTSYSGSLHAQYFFLNGVRMADEPPGAIRGVRFSIDSPPNVADMGQPSPEVTARED
jgi:hypothetical protein